MKSKFFATPAAWRAWLEKNHEHSQELLVGFYKKDSGKPSITWPESVDVALCFGWIDGVRRRIDDISYSIRFTPRKERSTWSSINIKRVEELTKLQLMHPAGIKAFGTHEERRSGLYSFEQQSIQFEARHEKTFQANEAAWEFFCSQPPGYQRVATWWVISAKKEETRQKRLATLIADSAKGRRIDQLNRQPRS